MPAGKARGEVRNRNRKKPNKTNLSEIADTHTNSCDKRRDEDEEDEIGDQEVQEEECENETAECDADDDGDEEVEVEEETEELSLERKEWEATSFLRKQSLVSILAFASLVAFFYFPYTIVVLTGVVVVTVASKFLEKSRDNATKLKGTGRSVLITGCDTGFGYLLASHLVSHGVQVFAGCLHPTGPGAKDLRHVKSTRLHVLPLDVTSDTQVKDAARIIRKKVGKQGLWGLVNNAGVTLVCNIELATMEQFQRVIEVNQMGTIRVTKAVLPLIRKAKGRIVNMSSIGGRLPQMHHATSCVSHAAIETFSDLLRREMVMFNVRVVVIEPGNFTGTTALYNLPRMEREYKDIWKSLSRGVRLAYGQEYVDHHMKVIKEEIEKSCIDLVPIMDAITESLLTLKPRFRYVVSGGQGWYDSAKWWLKLSAILPDWYIDGINLHSDRQFPRPSSLIDNDSTAA